jgi:hypothetical protein
MYDAEVFDRMVAYWNGHWRDKYVHLLPHIEEIKELTKLKSVINGTRLSVLRSSQVVRVM